MNSRSLSITAAAVALAFSCSPSAAQDNPYRLIRYEEDWSQACAEETSLKCVPIGSDGYVSFGGSIRARYEFYDNVAFGDRPSDPDGYGFGRMFLHSDAVLTPTVRSFVELRTAWAADRAGPARAGDRDSIDVQQAFVEQQFDGGDSFIRIGRQEPGFTGSARLIAPRLDLNARVTMDGLRVRSAHDASSIDAFLYWPVESRPGAFDNEPGDQVIVGALLTTRDWSGFDRVELYALGSRRDDARFVGGAGVDERAMVGARVLGSQNQATYEAEATLQAGETGGRNVRAWLLAGEASYRFNQAWSAGISGSAFSGDREPDDGVVETFAAPIARGKDFGDYGLLGPSNLFIAEPFAAWRPNPQVEVRASIQGFWRQAEADGLYDINARLVRTPLGSSERFVGWQPGVLMTWQIRPDVQLIALGRHFEPGPFIDDTGSNNPVTYTRVVLTWSFYRHV